MKKVLLLLLTACLVAPFFGVNLATAFTGATLVSVVVGFAVSPMRGVSLAIPIADSSKLFTNQLIAVYRERFQVGSFLRSFFPSEYVATREVSIAVKRGREKVSVDVKRYSEGNRNDFSLSSEKIFIPPYHKEYMIMNSHRLYDVVLTNLAMGNTTFFAEMTAEMAEDMAMLQDTIERSIELQASQILESGVITLNAAADIDFKRKAASIVDKGAGNYWATGTVDVFKDIENGCNFLRKTGKARGAIFNMIMGSEAHADLLTNQVFKDRNDLTNLSLDAVRPPQRESTGAAFHGEMSAGSYRVRLWTYPESYENASNVSTDYINTKKIVLLPENPRFLTRFAAVPQLIRNGTIPQTSEYLIREFIDEENTAHKMQIEAAPICIPLAIDQIYTLTVVA